MLRRRAGWLGGRRGEPRPPQDSAVDGRILQTYAPNWEGKYRTELELPDEILHADEPDRVLEERMGDLAFELDSWTSEAIRFTRGKPWGDFSVKLIKLQTSFPLPLQRKTSMKLEVASVCLFDTGDTWEVCRDLVDRVEATG